MKKNSELIILSIIAIALILIVGYQSMECVKCGGELVRGVFWFKCIK